MSSSKYYHKWKAEGKCAGCGGGRDRSSNVLCNKCRERNHRNRKKPKVVKKLLESRRRWYRKSKLEFLSHYGGKCACCGLQNPDILTLDHVGNDGAAHRRREGCSGTNLYRKIRAEGYPPGYQVLCYNCNLVRYYHGSCGSSEHY